MNISPNPSSVHIVLYVLSFVLSLGLLTRAITRRGDWIAPRIKLAFGILGVLGIFWTALGVQSRWPFLAVEPRFEFLLTWMKTFVTGAASGILGTLVLLGKVRLFVKNVPGETRRN